MEVSGPLRDEDARIGLFPAFGDEKEIRVILKLWLTVPLEIFHY